MCKLFSFAVSAISIKLTLSLGPSDTVPSHATLSIAVHPQHHVFPVTSEALLSSLGTKLLFVPPYSHGYLSVASSPSHPDSSPTHSLLICWRLRVSSRLITAHQLLTVSDNCSKR